MNPWDGAPRAGETETMAPAHTVHEAGEVVKIHPMVSLGRRAASRPSLLRKRKWGLALLT